jgi:hypothetical protein
MLTSLALLLCTVLLGLPASAQRPTPRTLPNQYGRPPIYDLFQQRRGILPNYYQFYMPQQRLQQNLRSQAYQLQRQGNAIQAMQNQWLTPQEQGADISPTGRGSTFMNYSHFYPALGGGGSRR